MCRDHVPLTLPRDPRKVWHKASGEEEEAAGKAAPTQEGGRKLPWSHTWGAAHGRTLLYDIVKNEHQHVVRLDVAMAHAALCQVGQRAEYAHDYEKLRACRDAGRQ